MRRFKGTCVPMAHLEMEACRYLAQKDLLTSSIVFPGECYTCGMNFIKINIFEVLKETPPLTPLS